MRGKGKSGKSRILTVASGKIDDIFWTVRQRINTQRVIGIGVFGSQSEERHKVRTREYHLFKKTTESSGCCLTCGDIDFRHLDEHHIDREKLFNFTITLCANCHRELHWNNGTIGVRKNG